jgi:predicted acyltransferase
MTSVDLSGASSVLPRVGRVVAVDRLRGLLVWLVVVVLLAPGAMAEWPGNGVSDRVLEQLRPSAWHGVTLADLLPAGWLFVLGIAGALSVQRRRQAGQRAGGIAAHLLWRCAALFAIGLVLDGGLLTAWPEVRWLGPWQRIAICNVCAGMLCLFADWKLLLALAGVILVNYALAFEMFPAESPPAARGSAGAPDPALSGPYSHARNVAARVDDALLPGRKYFGSWDPDGLLTTCPALAVTLLGAAAVPMLRRERSWLAVLVGMAAINAGVVLTEWQPANGWLLTPAFVLADEPVDYGRGVEPLLARRR